MSLNYEERVEMLNASDGCQLAFHIWKAKEEKAALFYIHGMQSNGGWLFETGPYLSNEGVSVFVLDRRGSGESGGIRGDVPSKETLIQDYKLAYQRMKTVSETSKITVVGQSLGGSLLMGLLAAKAFTDYEKAIFCAPALGQLHKRLTAEQREERSKQSGLKEFNVELPFEKYSTISKYIYFMANDKHVITKITANSRRVFWEMENQYYFSKEPITRKSMLICPKENKIIFLSNSKHIYEKMFKDGVILELPIDSHYMEFSRNQEMLWKAIIHFAIE